MKDERSGLLPALGVFTTMMVVIGGVIGSGVFRKSGVMAAEVGSPLVLLGVWVLAGVITMLGTLATAEVSGMIPETGGQYVYFERMYGPFVAYLYGWGVFAVIQTGSIAALAYVFAEFSTHFIPLGGLSENAAAWAIHLPFIGDVRPFHEFGVKVFAVGVIVVLTVINYIGVRFGGIVQDIFTIGKVTGMLLLLVAAFLPSTGGSWNNLTEPSAFIRKDGLTMLIAIAAALQGAFWAYDGWIKASYIAGEIRNAQHVLPRATVYGMLIVTALYLLMNLAYCWVLPIDEMAKSKLVAADAAEKVFSGGAKWIALVVMISTFGANNAVVLSSARVYFAMAQRNVFPAFFGRVHPRFHTPGASLIAQSVWSSALVFSGTFDMLTDTLIFVAWISYGLGVFGVFVLRRREPDTPRPYKVPGYPWVPGIFVLFSAAFLFLTIYNDVMNYRAAVAKGKPGLINCAFGTGLVLIGAPIYFFYRSRQKGVCAELQSSR
jgi:basic amino acid/polyamine antiporter, APA family